MGDKHCAKCFTHLISFDPSNSSILQRSTQQLSSIKYLAQDHTSQIWCWRLNSTLKNLCSFQSPQGRQQCELQLSQEGLAALDTDVWKTDFGLLKLYKQGKTLHSHSQSRPTAEQFCRHFSQNGYLVNMTLYKLCWVVNESNKKVTKT